MTPNMSVVPLTPELRESAHRLHPSVDQEKWSGTAVTILSRAQSRPSEHIFLIRDGETPAGMFVLDTAPRLPLDGIDLQLHSFFSDQDFQGRGLATAAICSIRDVVTEHFPETRLLGLSVNVNNPIAFRLYRIHGFTEADHMYLDGSRGPEHLLWMAFADSQR